MDDKSDEWEAWTVGPPQAATDMKVIGLTEVESKTIPFAIRFVSPKNPKEEKQLAVSLAVLEVIEAHGLLGVTHSKVARKAGVSRLDLRVSRKGQSRSDRVRG